MKLGMEVGLGPDDFVLDGVPAPPPEKRGRSPHFSAHVYCGQTAGRIKIVFGTEVGLSLGDLVVLDGDPASPPQKGGRAHSPIFGPILLWPNGWMHQDATWHGASLSLGNFVLDGDTAPSPKMGRSPLPNFRPISIVAKRLDASRCHLVRR